MIAERRSDFLGKDTTGAKGKVSIDNGDLAGRSEYPSN
jgi:hypothetical protein